MSQVSGVKSIKTLVKAIVRANVSKVEEFVKDELGGNPNCIVQLDGKVGSFLYHVVLRSIIAPLTEDKKYLVVEHLIKRLGTDPNIKSIGRTPIEELKGELVDDVQNKYQCQLNQKILKFLQKIQHPAILEEAHAAAEDAQDIVGEAQAAAAEVAQEYFDIPGEILDALEGSDQFLKTVPNSFEIVRAAVQNGLSINKIVDKPGSPVQGYNLLMKSFQGGQINIITYLLQNGGNVSIASINGTTMDEFVQFSQNKQNIGEMLDLISQCQANIDDEALDVVGDV